MKRLSGDWKFLLTFSGIVVALIVITGILAPNREDRDPTPGTWNSGHSCHMLALRTWSFNISVLRKMPAIA